MNLTQILLIFTSVFAAGIDLKTGRIPNVLTYFGTISIVLVSFFERSLNVALTGIVVTTLPLLILYTCTSGRGLGLGDVKFAACIGSALGWFIGLEAIGLAFVMGACVGGIGMIMGKYQRKSRIAFAPYLALAACCEAFLGSSIGIFR